MNGNHNDLPEVAGWIERAAVESGAEPGVRWDSVRLGRAAIEGELLGRAFRRTADLGAWRLTEPQIEELDALEEEAAVARAREWIERAREHARLRAERELGQDLETIRPLIEALPEEERAEAVAEAVVVLEEPSRSVRKLRKRLRRWLVALRTDELQGVIFEAMPELRMEETKGALTFEVVDVVPLEIWDRRLEIPVTARAFGGRLEQHFLAGDVERFVEEARETLRARLLDEEQAWRDAVHDIEAFVEKRGENRFYDQEQLRRVVFEELRDVAEREPADVVRGIRAATRRLDFIARERETVWRLVHEENLVAYKDLFPLARALERTLVLFVGPTNSGKTWHALNRLTEAGTGVYLAPLRLLALEGQEEVEKRGRVCSYMTGEERDIREGADFVASTIEMLDPAREVDAAVIDEVQMLADPDRGWAWCQALVGAPARTVYMTGSPDCIELVEAIAEYLGEPLHIHPLERFTPIEALDEAVSLDEVEPGTAVVAFSRRDVLRYKAQLGERFKVAVIYGNLTPEVRREEARRFREGEAEVLVATDAIAMGLNLPIRTVLFSTLRKWNGKEEVDLTTQQMLQIGGRAGRYGKYERGHVGALKEEDVARIRYVFRPGATVQPLPLLTQVRPLGPHVDVIADGIGTRSLRKTLVTFQRGMTFDTPMFVPGVTDEMIELAEIVDRYDHVPLPERLTLATAPVDIRSEISLYGYQEWVASYASEVASTLPPLPRSIVEKPHASTDEELHEAEKLAKALTTYAWLAFRFPARFPDLEECQDQRAALDSFIERSLAQQALRRTCRVCGKMLRRGFRHPMCDECFQKRRGRGDFRGGGAARRGGGGPRGGRRRAG